MFDFFSYFPNTEGKSDGVFENLNLWDLLNLVINVKNTF